MKEGFEITVPAYEIVKRKSKVAVFDVNVSTTKVNQTLQFTHADFKLLHKNVRRKKKWNEIIKKKNQKLFYFILA